MLKECFRRFVQRATEVLEKEQQQSLFVEQIYHLFEVTGLTLVVMEPIERLVSLPKLLMIGIDCFSR